MHTMRATWPRPRRRCLIASGGSWVARLLEYVLEQCDVNGKWLAVDVGATTGHRRIHRTAQRESVVCLNPEQRGPVGDVERAELLGIEVVCRRVDPPRDRLEGAAQGRPVRA